MSDDTDSVRTGAHRWRSAPAVATVFLTRLPLRAPDTPLADAALFFPVVGFGVGCAGGGAFWLASLTGLPALAAALIALAATALLTGALHEDGLADMADGLAGRDPAESIRIMRDSGAGAWGVLALVFGVGLRAAALAAVADPLAALMALVAVHGVSRAALPAIMRTFAPASGTGLGAAAGRPRLLDVWLGLVLAALAAFALLDAPVALAALAVSALAAGGVAGLARYRLGGYTGDVLGAVQQACEIAALLAIAAMI